MSMAFMPRNTQKMDKKLLAKRWDRLVSKLTEDFHADEELDIDGILFLIGVNELGFGPKKFKKDEKVNLIHIAICTVLEPYGYYKFTKYDDHGWPHFDSVSSLPSLKPGELSILMKEAIVEYALADQLLEFD